MVKTAIGRRLRLFLAFPGDKWERHQHGQRDRRSNQQRGCFHRRRKQAQHRVEPEENIIRPRRGLDDGGIGRAARSEGTEVDRAHGNREQDEAGEKQILGDCAGDKRHAFFARQVVIFPHVGRATDDSSRHRPVVDSQLQHQPQMQADEGQAAGPGSRTRATRRIAKASRPR